MSWTIYHEVSGPSRCGRRRVLAGEGMLTPTRDFTWRGERFRARVTRVSPDHEVAKSRHAQLLTPAYAKESGHEVLRFLERICGERSGHRGRREPWRLGPRERGRESSMP
jgi:hypothetical protein